MGRYGVIQRAGKLGERARRHAQREGPEVYLQHATLTGVDRRDLSLGEPSARAIGRFWGMLM